MGLHEAFKEAGINPHAIRQKAHNSNGVVNVDNEDAEGAKEVLRDIGYEIHSEEVEEDNVKPLLDEAEEPEPFTRITFGK